MQIDAQDALKVLANATGQLLLTRDDHIRVQASLNALSTVVAEYIILITPKKVKDGEKNIEPSTNGVQKKAIDKPAAVPVQ